VVTQDLAYTVEIERVRTRVAGSSELTQIAIRVTTVFRREDGAWKVTYRHGEPDHLDAPPGLGPSALSRSALGATLAPGV
jgi:ketosteroid isomerase-like protein